MKLEDLVKKYSFHDSLLEGIEYDETRKIAEFEIDFCNWAQTGYKSDAPETMMVRLCFSGVTAICNQTVHIESSSINDCRSIGDGTNGGLEFVIVRDYPNGDGGVDMIRIYADSVEFVAEG